jgi:CHAT domain-containing protein
MGKARRLRQAALFGLSLAAVHFLPACDPPERGAPPALSPAEATPRPDDLADRLRPGPGSRRRIGGRQAQRHDIELTAGEYVHLIVRQQGIDVVVDVFSPDGRRRFKVDSLTGSSSDEHVFLVADRPGAYRIEVHPFDPAARPATYHIRIAELRPATEGDRLHASAERAFAEARELEERSAGTLPRRAAGLYLQAACLWQRAGSPRRQADALYHLARMYRAFGFDREAVHYFEQALPLRSPHELPQARAVLLNDVGATYRDLGEDRAARQCLEEALALHRRAAFRQGEATTLLNLGDLYRRQGRDLAALDHFEQAFFVLQGLKNRQGKATALNEIGTLYTALGKATLALRNHRQALQLLDWQQDTDGWVATLNLMGNAHVAAGDLPAAAHAYHQALALRERLTNPRNAAISLAGLGLVAERRNDFSQALSRDQEALAIFEAQQDRRSIGILLNNLGWLYSRTGEPVRALELYEQALARARTSHDPALEAAARFGMARAERQQGHLETASRQIQSAVSLVETFRQRALRSDLRTSYLASRQDYFSFYIDLLMEQHRRRPAAGYDALALGISEQSRARQLLDALAEDRDEVLRGIAPELLAREKALRQALNDHEQRRLELVAQGAGPQALEAMRRQQEANLSSYYQIEAKIRRASPWYASLSVPTPLALPEIQRQVVDRDTVLLEIQLGSPQSFLWVVTPSSVRSFVLADRTVLENVARRAHRMLADSHQVTATAAARRAAAELSWRVLGPAASLLGSKRLVVVASGALQSIPFAALPEPSPAGPDPLAPPLVKRHEVVHLPSASALASLRQQTAARMPPSKLLAVVADPVFSRDDERLQGRLAPAQARPQSWEAGLPRFERLPYSRAEAEAILAIASGRGRPSQKFTGFEASRQLVLSGKLADFQILHFSTHGWLDTVHPELSALLLSRFTADGRPQDGRLRMHETYGLELSADLVVLGGCQTALGRETEGEGIEGLARGFLYAGARRVLVSLWSVGDQATAELMKRFYQALLVDGLPPPAALRRAQLSMIDEERWNAPSRWAGFVLQGDWT